MSRSWLVAPLLALALAGTGCEKKAEAGPAQGRELFTNTCVRCHGADGKGGLPVFDGGPSPRNFTDHTFQNSRTDEQIKLTIVNGKGTGMPAFGPVFNDAQLTALVAYVRSLDSESKK